MSGVAARVGRRAFAGAIADVLAGGVLGGLGGAACGRTRSSSNEGDATRGLALDGAIAAAGHRLLEWSFDGAGAQGGPERVAVLVPTAAPSRPVPVLVALHGRGEAVRGPEVGAHAWPKTYELPKAMAALGRERLTTRDMGDMVEPQRLEALNRSLAAHAWAGLVVVCPHVPDLTGARNLAATERWGRFLIDVVLPRVRSECGAYAAGAVGIDGVSLGGRVAMLVGLAAPDVFASVGALQPAFSASEAADVAARARGYAARRAGAKIRLLTSDGDYFKPTVAAIDEAMRLAGVEHEAIVVKGPHDYSFNQGPGGIEMLIWHERVLRGLPSP